MAGRPGDRLFADRSAIAAPPAAVRAVLSQNEAGGVASAFADLEIFIHDDWLAVLGKRPPEHTQSAVSYRTYERTYSGFWRAFRLFPSISALGVRGALRNGVFTLSVRKKRRSLVRAAMSQPSLS